MTVRGTGSCAFAACTPTDAEMSPRLKLTATPYAFAAGKLAQFGGTYTSNLTIASPTGGNQNFVIPDQAAAGTYQLATTAGVIQNQTSGTQTANFNIQSSAVGTVTAIVQGAASQTADILQVKGNGVGTPYFDVAANGRVGISVATPGYQLDVAGDINTSTAYRVGGVSGTTIACGATAGLQNTSLVGGIITGGSCVTNTLQSGYDNSGAGYATPAFAQQATNTATGTTVAATLTSTAGNLLVATVGLATGATQQVSSITDTAGNTWTRAGSGLVAGSNTRTELWYASNVVGGVSNTITANISASMAVTLNVSEYSGIASSSAFDVTNNAGTTSSTTGTTGSITTTAANELVVGAMSYSSASATTTGPGAPWTSLTDVDNSPKHTRAAYQAVSVIGTYTANWTISAAQNSGGVIASFRAKTLGSAPITLSDSKDLVITATDTATDPNVLINLQCVTSCGANGRFAIQSGGSDVFSVSPNGGAAKFKNSTDSSSAFKVQSSAGTNILNIDSSQQIATIGVSNVSTAKLSVAATSTVGLRAFQGGTSDIGQFASAGTGVGTVATNATTTLTGTSSLFTQYFRVGDGIIVNGQLRTISTIASDTSLTVSSAFTGTASGLAYANAALGSGTVTTNGTTAIVGSSTTFTTTFKVGDTIAINGETAIGTISAIADNTHLTLFAAAATSAAGLSYGRSGYDRLIVGANGNVGIGTNVPGAALQIQTAGVAQKGLILSAASGQTANLLQAQDASGNINAALSAAGNQLTLGKLNTTAGTLLLNDGGSAFGATIVTQTLGADRKFIIPDYSLATTATPGTICVFVGAASNCPAATGSAYYVQNTNAVQAATNFYIRSAATNFVGGVIEGASGQTSDLLDLNTFNGTTSTTVAKFNNVGALTAVGVNAGAGLIQGTAGLTVSGAITNINDSSNFATNINTGTSTGAVSIGNSASGTLTLQGNASSTIVANNGANKTTLNFTTPTGTNTITFPNASGTVQLAAGSGSYIKQVPVATSDNTITPATTGVVGLTVNGTNTGTAATALAVSQPGAAAGITIASASNTATNGISFSGTFASNLISSTNFSVSNAGAVTAVGVNAGAGLIQGTAGLTVSGAITNINASSNFATNINTGSSTGAVSIGNTTGNTAITLDSGTAAINIGINGSQTGNVVLGSGSNTISANSSISVATGKSINFVGGNTASRPASPAEGTVYYDTTTKQLIVFSNGKWQSDRTSVTKIVAASNASQAEKDSADYVATGTNDEATINTALTAAAGGKVYLTEGTFTTLDVISIPNNTTLAGSGRGTLIQFGNIAGLTKNMITNTDTTTGTGVVVRDLMLDGNKATNTTGTQNGISFTTMGSGSGSTAKQGATVTNISVMNFNQSGIVLNSSANSTVTGNTSQANTLYGIYMNASNRSTVTGNISQGNTGFGINISGNLYGVFSDNVVSGNASSGINLNGSSASNLISNNSIRDNGGAGANDSIRLVSSSNNTITGNVITDTAGTGYAIDVTDAASTSNYISGNTYSGTGATTMNDAGTTTMFGGQIDGTGAFLVQPAGGITLTSTAAVGITGATGVNIDTNAAAQTIAIGTSPNSRTINIGTGAAAQTVTIGSTTAGSSVTLQAASGSSIGLNAAAVTTNQASVSLFNTTATTLNFAGAGTTINIGATTAGSTTTINTPNIVLGNTTNRGTVTNNSATQNATLDFADQATGLSMTASTSVDIYTAFTFNQSTAGQTMTVPAPTSAVGGRGRIIYISNRGSTTFTVAPSGGTSFILGTNATATLYWNGTVWTGAGVDGGSASYIQNQNAVAQSANFNIGGTGAAGTGFTAPSYERATPGAIALGTSSNTNALNIGSTSLTGILSLDSGASSTINIGSGGSARTINLGTGAAAQAVTVGSINTSSALTLQSGVTGALSLTSQGGGINIGTNSVSQNILLGNATGGTVTIGQNGGTVAINGTNFDVSTTGIVTLAGGLAQDINTAASATAANSITLQPGTSAGASSNGAATTIKGGDGTGTTTVVGGALTLQAGSATGASGSRTGGNVVIDAGTGATANGTITIGTGNATSVTIGQIATTTTIKGSLTSGNAAGTGLLTNNGATQNATLDFSADQPTGLSLTASTSVDIYTAITFNQTTTGQTMTIPAPTAGAAGRGRLLYISNRGSATFTLAPSGGTSFVLGTNATATLYWNGAAWTNAGVDGGSASYIQNQNTATQSVANFRISGTGQAANFDALPATALGIGNSAATGVTIGNTANTTAFLVQGAAAATYTIGTAANTGGIVLGNSAATNTIAIGASAGNAATQTINIGTSATAGSTTTLTIGSTVAGTTTLQSAGGTTINSNTTVSSGKTFTVTAGATNLTGAAGGSSTAATIATGAASNVGLKLQGAASQTADLLQLQDSSGNNLVRIDASGNQETIGFINTPTGGFGQYGNLLTYSEQFDNAAWTKTATITANSTVAPDGTTTADTVAGSASGQFALQNSTLAPTNTSYTFSVWLRTSSGTQNAGIRIKGSATGVGTEQTFTVTTAWQRYSVTQNVNGYTGLVQVNLFPGTSAGTGTVIAWGGQLVNATTPQTYARTLGTTQSSVSGTVSNGTTFTNNGSTLNNSLALGDLAAGAIGGNTATVDIFTSFTISPTVSGRTYTIPAPSDGAAGRTIYISNINATNTFIIGGTTFNTHSTATLVYDGTSWNFAGMDGGSTNYIQNQNTATQSVANFRISGTGQAANFDALPATALGIGNSAATGVTIGNTANTTAFLVQGAAAATYTIGTAANTGGIVLGNSAATNTIAIGASAGNAATQTINIGTSATAGSTTTINIGSSIGGAITLGQGGGTVAVNGTNFDVSTAGIVTLAGGSVTQDINTAAAGTSNAITIQPGNSTTNSGTGSALNLKGSNQTGTTSTGGAVNIQGGTGTSGTTPYGAVNINTGTNTGAVNIGSTSGGQTSVFSSILQVGGAGSAKLLGAGNAGLSVITADMSTGSTNSGYAFLGSGWTFGATSNTGVVELASGNATVSGNSGDVYLLTGNAASGNSGSITLNVGTKGGAGTLGDIKIGDTSVRNIVIGSATAAGYSINANGASTISTALGGTNSLTISSGDQLTISNQGGTFDLLAAGPATYKTTNNAGAGNTNPITIQSGNASVNTAGTVTIDTGSSAAGTSQINIGTTNAGAIAIGKTTTTTTVNGSLTTGSAAATTTFTNNGSTVNTASALSNFASNAAIGTNTATVDKFTYFTIPQTTANITLTVPTPTASGTLGRIIYITNTGTVNFTLITATLAPGATATLVWTSVNGTPAWTFAGADASSILNQTSTPGVAQTGNFNINGSGLAAKLQAASDSTSAFTTENSLGANILTVDTTNTASGLNLINNGGAETGTPPTNWAGQGTGTVAAGTGTDAASGLQSAKVTFGTTANNGTKVTFATAPTASTTAVYNVSFSVKQVSGTAVGPGNVSPALQVLYSPDNGTTLTATCSNYSQSANISTTVWTKVTCTFIPGSTAVTTALLIIRQLDAPGVSRVIDIDNLSVVAQNNTGTQNGGLVRLGGPTSQGLTLFQLDTYASNPFTGSNAALAGAMYFDTTADKMQCYDGSVWGACGAAPNSNITLTPEYTGAVLHGTDIYSTGVDKNIGTLNSDFCATSAALTVGSLCASGDARNFYSWTTVQPSYQSYSIFVTYKLPSTFKAFVGNVSLTGRVDNTTNAGVNYGIYRSSGGTIAQCGGGAANVVGWNNSTANGSANTWTTAPSPLNPATGCSFTANDYMIVRIDTIAKSSANAYIENLNFSYSNQ